MKRAGTKRAGTKRAGTKRAAKAGAALKQAISAMPPQLREVAAEAVHAMGERIRLRAAPAELTSEAVHAVADLIEEKPQGTSSTT